MPNSVSDKDVMLALLALDAYNRHRQEGERKMGDVGGSQLSNKIGDVIFKRSSDRVEGITVTVHFIEPPSLRRSLKSMRVTEKAGEGAIYQYLMLPNIS
jgi:hypothetical protein